MAAPKSALKFAAGTCFVAIAVASASPRFRPNPMLDHIGHSLGSDLREILPHTLNRVRDTMERR
jgi:hypothetical protein